MTVRALPTAEPALGAGVRVSSSSSSAMTLAGRSSVSEMRSPRLRNAVSCSRLDRVSKDHSVVSKIAVSGQNVVVVPVSAVASPLCSGPSGAPTR